MKPTKTLFPIFLFSITLLFLLLTSCSRNREFFYRYKADDDGYFLFNNHRYSILVDEREFEHLPKPVARYLTQSQLKNKQRITEAFIKYKGSVQTNLFEFDLTKKYLAEDHCSGMEARFITQVRSFPGLRARASFNQVGTIEAKMATKKLLKSEDSQGEAIDELCLLKYLSQMVWYPSAFLIDNVFWEPNAVDGKNNENRIALKLVEKLFSASGILEFDSISYQPTRFRGTITKNISEKFLITLFEVDYSAIKAFDSYHLPSKCIAQITNSINEKTILDMELVDYKIVDYEMVFSKEKKGSLIEKQKTIREGKKVGRLKQEKRKTKTGERKEEK